MFGKNAAKSASVNHALMPAPRAGAGGVVVGAGVGAEVGNGAGAVGAGVGAEVGDGAAVVGAGVGAPVPGLGPGPPPTSRVQNGDGQPYAGFAHQGMKVWSWHHRLMLQSSWRLHAPAPAPGPGAGMVEE
mmetsp:Transcript_121547/g.349363  ORF Transcript_121547/g.349363 Transcript_121547/m.349363 type:complete len:130 (+) Transcript_121547:481-870(+)